MRDGYVFHIDGPLSLFSATTKYGLQMALFLPALLHLPTTSASTPSCAGARSASRGASTSTSTRRPGLAPGRHRHLRPGRAGRVRRTVPPGRPGLGDQRVHRGHRAGPRGDLGPRLPVRPPRHRHRRLRRGPRLLEAVEPRAAARGSCPSTARRRFVLAISDRLKVDEEALQDFQGPVLRFKEIPNASELAGLLNAFLDESTAIG